VQGSDPWSLLVESGTTLLSTIESLFILVFALIFRTDLSESRKILGFDLRRRTVLTTDRVVDFLAMHADLFGGVDPDADFIPSNIDDGDFNVVADHDRFIALPGQHQHGGSFLGKGSEKVQIRTCLATSVSPVRSPGISDSSPEGASLVRKFCFPDRLHRQTGKPKRLMPTWPAELPTEAAAKVGGWSISSRS